jgi:hypothetical protein
MQGKRAKIRANPARDDCILGLKQRLNTRFGMLTFYSKADRIMNATVEAHG